MRKKVIPNVYDIDCEIVINDFAYNFIIRTHLQSILPFTLLSTIKLKIFLTSSIEQAATLEFERVDFQPKIRHTVSSL